MWKHTSFYSISQHKEIEAMAQELEVPNFVVVGAIETILQYMHITTVSENGDAFERGDIEKLLDWKSMPQSGNHSIEDTLVRHGFLSRSDSDDDDPGYYLVWIKNYREIVPDFVMKKQEKRRALFRKEATEIISG